MTVMDYIAAAFVAAAFVAVVVLGAGYLGMRKREAEPRIFSAERRLLAEKLEAMCCNAPRAHCGRGLECDCTILMKAAKELRK